MKLTKSKTEDKKISNLKVKVLAELYSARAFLYLLFLAIQFVISYFINRVLETVVILIAYTLLRWCYPTTWHHKDTLYCFIYSIFFFFILEHLVLPLYMSICSGVVISMIFTYYLYKLQVLIDKSIQKARTEQTIFDLTKDEFYSLLNQSTMSQEEKDAVEYRLVYHYKGSEWYRAVGYCKRNCQYLYKRGIEKLNKLLQTKQ